MKNFANLIAIGGPISVGKSTLVDQLGFPQIQEINDEDRIQNLLLELLYERKRVSSEVIELYFLEMRIKNYIDYSNTLQTHVIDRTILESLWFASKNLEKKYFYFFKKLWMKEIKTLFKNYGKPKLYIFLTMDWNTFKTRIFKRGREFEIKNFFENEEYFKSHILEYEKLMIKIFKKFKINFFKISTDNLSEKDVLKIALTKIKEVV